MHPLPQTLTGAEILAAIRHRRQEMAQRFGVSRLAVFGSTVKQTRRPDSDVDVLVAFTGPATSDRFFGLMFFLEDLTGLPIDLVTEKGLRAELRPIIEREAVDV